MSSGITFILNGKVCTVADLDPSTTLLQYLRHQQLLTGTKEGCGEGDCGACTIVVGEVVGEQHQGQVRYSAINACIQFIAMLEGKSVWTVEALQGGDLHPVQQAFVDTHGTQCGFCTPGFVMSLFAAYLNGESLDTHNANDVFAGNLCRCTGYGSIADAAEQIQGMSVSAQDTARLTRDAEQLAAIASDQTVTLTGADKIFHSPAHADDLATLYANNPDATLIAGATDVGLWVTKQHRELPVMIHLGRVQELRAISETSDLITIGAGVTHADALPVLAKHIPDFGELLRRLGATQVRNSGTLVGNIANGSPIGDTPPALMVLGAKINLRCGDQRRKIALDDYFIAYGKQDRQPSEFLESVEIPLPIDPEAAKFYKVTKRFDQDISAICGCFHLQVEGGNVSHARIAFGGMAGTPLRATAVENALIGQSWNQATITAAMAKFDDDYTPLTDMRASAEYRQQVAKNLLQRYFIESHNPLSATRLVGRGSAYA